MKNRLTFEWGVIPGREVGKITKRFHKRRSADDYVRAIAKEHGVTMKEARRYMWQSIAQHRTASTQDKLDDIAACEHGRQVRLSDAEVKRVTSSNDRAARVAAYLETLS